MIHESVDLKGVVCYKLQHVPAFVHSSQVLSWSSRSEFGGNFSSKFHFSALKFPIRVSRFGGRGTREPF